MKWGRATKRKWQTRRSERDAVSEREREEEGESYCRINKGGGEVFVELRGCWVKSEKLCLFPALYCMLSYLCEGPLVGVQLWIWREGWWGGGGGAWAASPGQEAGSEYLINSHHDSEDLLPCAAGPRHPQSKPALRPEQWSMNAPAQRGHCRANMEQGLQGTARTIHLFFYSNATPR